MAEIFKKLNPVIIELDRLLSPTRRWFQDILNEELRQDEQVECNLVEARSTTS